VQQQVPPFAMPVWHYLTLHLHDKSRTALLEGGGGIGVKTNCREMPASFLAASGNVCVCGRYSSDPSGRQFSWMFAVAGRANERPGCCSAGCARQHPELTFPCGYRCDHEAATT
jgi:hypothetical protein